MPREVQEEVARQIKEAVRQGVKIVTASVSHRSDDMVRANPELRGRVMVVDLDYWSEADLRKIAEKGFETLHSKVNNDALADFTVESAGSPQLMQSICLSTCFEVGLRSKPLAERKTFEINEATRKQIYERTAATTDFRSLIDVLDSGPKTRGTERKIYRFTDNSQGDVYRCILKAVASNPPKLSFPYDDILQRLNKICASDTPLGSSIIGRCLHMSRLALEKFPKERVIDWGEQKQIFDIPDPYLVFYLRWSGRLMEANE
jgi:hypothetical protein